MMQQKHLMKEQRRRRRRQQTTTNHPDNQRVTETSPLSPEASSARTFLSPCCAGDDDDDDQKSSLTHTRVKREPDYFPGSELSVAYADKETAEPKRDPIFRVISSTHLPKLQISCVQMLEQNPDGAKASSKQAEISFCADPLSFSLFQCGEGGFCFCSD